HVDVCVERVSRIYGHGLRRVFESVRAIFVVVAGSADETLVGLRTCDRRRVAGDKSPRVMEVLFDRSLRQCIVEIWHVGRRLGRRSGTVTLAGTIKGGAPAVGYERHSYGGFAGETYVCGWYFQTHPAPLRRQRAHAAAADSTIYAIVADPIAFRSITPVSTVLPAPSLVSPRQHQLLWLEART